MKAFRYKGDLYIRCIPAKTLFHSTLVHEVVNRGDIFAVEIATQQLTIIPGLAQVEHLELEAVISEKVPSITVAEMKKHVVNARLKAAIEAKLSQLELEI
jgi:hypothetical protein